MTLTPSFDARQSDPTESEQALAWALISNAVRKVEPGVFEVRGDRTGPDGRVQPVKLRVRVEELR